MKTKLNLLSYQSLLIFILINLGSVDICAQVDFNDLKKRYPDYESDYQSGNFTKITREFPEILKEFPNRKLAEKEHREIQFKYIGLLTRSYLMLGQDSLAECAQNEFYHIYPHPRFYQHYDTSLRPKAHYNRLLERLKPKQILNIGFYGSVSIEDLVGQVGIFGSVELEKNVNLDLLLGFAYNSRIPGEANSFKTIISSGNELTSIIQYNEQQVLFNIEPLIRAKLLPFLNDEQIYVYGLFGLRYNRLLSAFAGKDYPLSDINRRRVKHTYEIEIGAGLINSRSSRFEFAFVYTTTNQDAINNTETIEMPGLRTTYIDQFNGDGDFRVRIRYLYNLKSFYKYPKKFKKIY